MERNRTVLVVEDEQNIRDLVCLHLGLEGYECVPVGDGKAAMAMASERAFDLIILDLMLPGMDGVTVTRAIRRHGPNRDAPILMLTARREEADKVMGLDSGADDYLTKPFGIRELMARAAALTRRTRGTLTAGDANARPLEVHGIELDPSRRSVRARGAAVDVTRQEFNLLYVLASSPGIVFTRERLLSKVWQEQSFVTGRSVDTLVKRLRKKIEVDPAEPQLILTVWGDGYKFADV
ncbi:MAG TPA: response regulator transcription factor [Vicinamibacterales bacterium]|nr:response regulator transcription factor [Vicinamibacterales bacterium]